MIDTEAKVKYTELIAIRIRLGTRAALQAKANEEDVSLSHVVRKAIKEWLAKDK